MWTVWLHLLCSVRTALVILLLSRHLVRPMWKRTLFFISAQLSLVFYTQFFSSFLLLLWSFSRHLQGLFSTMKYFFPGFWASNINETFSLFYYSVRGICQMVFFLTCGVWLLRWRKKNVTKIRNWVFFSHFKWFILQSSTIILWEFFGNKISFVATS